MGWTLGIDLACRAAHVASLAGPNGTLAWSGRTFFTRPDDLERLWADVGVDAGELTVVMEPTRNAWSPVAAWFDRRGVKVVLVPTTQSADLRAYYSKHTKSTGSTPSCWPGCRCCILKGCAPTAGSGLPTRCVERPSNGPRSSSAAPRFSPGSTPCSSCSGRAGTKSWGLTTATRRCTCWPATPTRST